LLTRRLVRRTRECHVLEEASKFPRESEKIQAESRVVGRGCERYSVFFKERKIPGRWLQLFQCSLPVWLHRDSAVYDFAGESAIAILSHQVLSCIGECHPHFPPAILTAGNWELRLMAAANLVKSIHGGRDGQMQKAASNFRGRWRFQINLEDFVISFQEPEQL